MNRSFSLLISPLSLLAALIILFFLSPYLILISHLQEVDWIDFSEFAWAFKNSFLQAILSLFIAIILSALMVEGIFFVRRTRLPESLKLTYEFLILLPSFLPALFTLLIFLSIVQPFPFGNFGAALIHGMTYSGILTVLAATILQGKAKGLLEVSYLLGVKKWRMYIEAMRMLKYDFISLTLLIFTACFTSFSIPIAVGGGKGTTIEVLIYEKMKTTGSWPQALLLSLMQMILIALLTVFFVRRQSLQLKLQMSRSTPVMFMGSVKSFVISSAYVLFFLIGFLFFSIQGWSQVFAIEGLWREVLQVLPATVMTGLLSGFCILALFMLASVAVFLPALNLFFLAVVAPSVSLLGLSVILFSSNFAFANSSTFPIEEYLFYLLSILILFFAPLYKMGFHQSLLRLRSQVEVARLLGASSWLTLKQIVWPQVLPSALQLSGVAALWVVGDFALCRVIFTKSFLLSQMIDSLMISYRIGPATSLMSLMLLIGLLMYLLFAGVGNVLRQKFIQKI